jgi:hypothetical protein
MGENIWAELSRKEDVTLSELFDTAGFVEFVKYQNYDHRGAWAKMFLVEHMADLCM